MPRLLLFHRPKDNRGGKPPRAWKKAENPIHANEKISAELRHLPSEHYSIIHQQVQEDIQYKYRRAWKEIFLGDRPAGPIPIVRRFPTLERWFPKRLGKIFRNHSSKIWLVVQQSRLWKILGWLKCCKFYKTESTVPELRGAAVLLPRELWQFAIHPPTEPPISDQAVPGPTRGNLCWCVEGR